MKNWNSKHRSNEEREKINGSESFNKKMTMMMKKKKRIGGGGLSLEAFANAKTKDSHYNPSLIKKQREFYKNAKYVHKYKKSLQQQQSGQNDSSLAARLLVQDRNETGEASKMNEKNKKNNSFSLKQLYEKKRQKEDNARIERDAIVRAKEEAKEKSVSQRKASREKMLKKTRFGQPVMKYRIEHLLETLQGSTT